jgi:NAD+ kinase
MKNIARCIVVIKQTALAQGGRAADFARKGDETAHRLVHADREHQRTVDTVRKTLAKHRVPFEEVLLRDLKAASKRALGVADFVLSIGGDGTALGASHYVRAGAMLGVNSAPGDSVGHFCAVDRTTFGERFAEILAETWRPTPLARLQITLDDKPLPELALNDVLIAHESPASTTRYLIRVGELEEEHRSSGLWVSTAAGSTAGIRSAGGRVMPRRSRRIQFRVRELYREPNRTYSLTHGILAPGDAEPPLVIASKMPGGELYIDGSRTMYPFPFGSRARIDIAAASLMLYV